VTGPVLVPGLSLLPAPAGQILCLSEAGGELHHRAQNCGFDVIDFAYICILFRYLHSGFLSATL